jgi:hypothetical protein
MRLIPDFKSQFRNPEAPFYTKFFGKSPKFSKQMKQLSMQVSKFLRYAYVNVMVVLEKYFGNYRKSLFCGTKLRQLAMLRICFLIPGTTASNPGIESRRK